MIITGDSLDELKKLEADSIDAVITDPPYGYSFMGKDWDKAVPSVEIWQECLRVLKPGAWCMVMSAPRSDVQNAMISRLMEAGFRLDFTPIYWTYASGFPKAGNVGKLVDKRNGRNLDLYKEIGRHIKERREASNFNLKDMNQLFGYVAGCTWWESQNDNNVRLPNLQDWLRLVELIGVDEKYTEIVEREEAIGDKVGEKVRSTAGFSNETVPRPWKSRVGEVMDLRAPALDQAKALDGSYTGFQPKPAVEVIIVAMKPLSEKTYVDQALKNGKGITWLDDGRIPYGSKADMAIRENTHRESNIVDGKVFGGGSYSQPVEAGRFPANLLVQDDVLNDGTSRRSNGNKSSFENKPVNSGFLQDVTTQTTPYSDSGSYSRYFDLDAWWAKTFPFLIVPKASKSEKNKGLEHLDEKGSVSNSIGFDETKRNRQPRNAMSKNHHPTVKPLKLMSYLITLTTREGDTVLDPFVGSGTTVLAAKQLNRKGIGIEREPEYAEIAQSRLDATQYQPKIEQTNLI